MPTIRTSSRCLSPYFTKANFEIRRPDPNSNPPPTQNTPRNKPSGHSRILPNPTITRQYYLSQFCNTVKKCISAVISPACKAITYQPKAKRRGGSRKATPWVVGRWIAYALLRAPQFFRERTQGTKAVGMALFRRILRPFSIA